MKVEIIKGEYRKNYKSQKLKVAAYVRVSTELEAQLSSFESQRKYYLDKIHRNSNWKFVDIYEDYGISARSVKNRVGFNRMIKDALDGKIDLILTKSISRFARNTVDSIEYVRLLKEHNVGIIFEEEGIYTLDMQSELLLTILSSVAEQESNNNASRTKMGIKMNFLEGKNRMQQVVYGYKYKDRKLLINKKEAETIKRIFELYTTGTSVSDICKILNEEKIKTPYKKNWIPDYVYIILRCEKYIGLLKFGNTYKYENLRIVSDEIFYEAKEILKNNKATLKADYDIFSGILRCGFCGRNQGYCSNTKLFSTATCRRCGCNNGLNISLKNFNRILLEFQNEVLENYESIFKHRSKDINLINREKSKIEKENLDRTWFLVNLRLNNRISKYEFATEMDKCRTKYETEISNIHQEDIEVIKLNKTLDILKEKLLNIDSFPANEASKELINKLVKYLQFGETLKHNYKNRFNCRIVLKIDDNYLPQKFKHKVDFNKLCKNDNYIELWKFHSVFYHKKQIKYIKVKIVIDKGDIIDGSKNY